VSQPGRFTAGKDRAANERPSFTPFTGFRARAPHWRQSPWTGRGDASHTPFPGAEATGL